MIVALASDRDPFITAHQRHRVLVMVEVVLLQNRGGGAARNIQYI